MKTPSEPAALPAEGDAPEADARARTSQTDETDAPAEAREASAPPAGRPSIHSELPKKPKHPARRVLRTVFWLLWFVVVPFVVACVVVWLLTPPSGVERAGLLGFVEAFVREQPVPVGIGTFTLVEIALWSQRQRLPLASFAQSISRGDLPKRVRPAFDRARALLEEAEVILEREAKGVERDCSPAERERLRASLDGLEHVMSRKRFDEERFLEALGRAESEVELRLGRFRKSEVREYLESILVAVGVAMALRAFVVEAFKIPSGSMIPTLLVGDHIFVNKFAYGPAIPFTKARFWTRMPPERGDVMVFAFPEKPEQDFIKRVIALPGDKLEAKGGHPILNGWVVPSCYVGTYAYAEGDLPPREGELFIEYLGDESFLTLYDRLSLSSGEYQGPYYVKPGEVWVMGDNRNNSHDSRVWWNGQGGGVPFENVKGRALFVWLSVSDAGMDWSRLGTPVMGRPRMPEAMKHLEPGITKCLRSRPAVTLPPPPGSGGKGPSPAAGPGAGE